MLVSFDVSSLFTNVPIDEAVQVIRDRLRGDETLVNRTTLSPDRVAELLEACLRSTYFCYGGEFYEQREGAAMGSPVSAVVANLYMEFFEELALKSAPSKPRLWKTYVDDTCCIVKKGTVEGLLSHLNSVRPSIGFTVEVEREGSLPFLDTLLQRRDDGSLDVTVYRKPTHTDRYLDFQSHHPSHVKRGLVRCLYDRARSITTRQENLKKEECHLAEVLKQNGYPSSFIRSSSVPSRRNVEVTEAPLPEGGRRPPLVMLPYTEGVSEDIRRVCREVGPCRTCMGEPPPIKWEEATVIDQARTNKELLLKEAIHIRLQHPHLNRDGGLELPGCWVAALKGTAARVDRRQPATSGDTA